MRFASTVSFVLLFSGVAGAQAPNWSQLTTTTSPPPMHSHAMVYVLPRLKTVLLGAPRLTGPGQTWEWNGIRWAQVKTTRVPAQVIGAAMAYDAGRNRVVVFGGYGNGSHSDKTWEYDGTDWTEVQLAVGSPRPRAMRYGSMVYDAARGRCVLFGGGERVQYDETWEYDGRARTWRQIATRNKPGPRYFFGMVYDEARARTVLFGGGQGRASYQDTWEYDGIDWTRMTSAISPSVRWGHAMAYDRSRQLVVLHGGRMGANYYTDTWEWDGEEWIRISPAGTQPPVRQAHAMAYDLIGGGMLMFGGQSPIAQTLWGTWLYKSGRITARFQAFGTGCGTPAAKLSRGPARPRIGSAFTLVASDLPATERTGWMTFGVAQRPALALDPFGFPGCSLYHSLDEIVGFPLNGGRGQLTGNVPNVTALVGSEVFVQAVAGNVVTDAGAIRLGDQ